MALANKENNEAAQLPASPQENNAPQAPQPAAPAPGRDGNPKSEGTAGVPQPCMHKTPPDRAAPEPRCPLPVGFLWVAAHLSFFFPFSL